MGTLLDGRDRIGIMPFLESQPGMRLRPPQPRQVHMEGTFAFTAESDMGPLVEDVFELEIIVPEQYPHALTQVIETGGRIPKDPDHHVYQSGALCLGSPLRLLQLAQEASGLTEYFEFTLIPFLYAFSHGETTGQHFIFGELEHGADGLRDDYGSLIGLTEPSAVDAALRLLGMKKRKANKEPCPCGCGRRLGVCSFNETIRDLRDQFGRSTVRDLHVRPFGSCTSPAPASANSDSEDKDRYELIFSPSPFIPPPQVFL